MKLSDFKSALKNLSHLELTVLVREMRHRRIHSERYKSKAQKEKDIKRVQLKELFIEKLKAIPKSLAVRLF
jgi:hypothetical protein